VQYEIGIWLLRGEEFEFHCKQLAAQVPELSLEEVNVEELPDNPEDATWYSRQDWPLSLI
jgi:hypothetical protein